MIPPEDENHELLVHRMASLIPMFFVYLLFVGFFICDMVRYWPSLYEFDITVPTRGVGTEPVPTEIPPIRIADDGTVSFGALRLPKSDRDLESLVGHLRQIAPHTSRENSLPVKPDAHSKHERLVEVLSAILRSGIHDYHLL